MNKHPVKTILVQGLNTTPQQLLENVLAPLFEAVSEEEIENKLCEIKKKLEKTGMFRWMNIRQKKGNGGEIEICFEIEERRFKAYLGSGIEDKQPHLQVSGSCPNLLGGGENLLATAKLHQKKAPSFQLDFAWPTATLSGLLGVSFGLSRKTAGRVVHPNMTFSYRHVENDKKTLLEIQTQELISAKERITYRLAKGLSWIKTEIVGFASKYPLAKTQLLLRTVKRMNFFSIQGTARAGILLGDHPKERYLLGGPTSVRGQLSSQSPCRTPNGSFVLEGGVSSLLPLRKVQTKNILIQFFLNAGVGAFWSWKSGMEYGVPISSMGTGLTCEVAKKTKLEVNLCFPLLSKKGFGVEVGIGQEFL